MINIIYWSGTGNTEKMAKLIAEGAKSCNKEVDIKFVSEASLEDVEKCEVLVLGCPSMGAEELEESEMEPFVESLRDKVSSKKVALFGSYGWGNGEWMDSWKSRMEDYNADVFLEPLTINECPNREDETKCIEFGKDICR